MPRTGRPPTGGVTKVKLTLVVAPASLEWLDATAAEFGISRAELVRMLLARGKQAWSAGWHGGLTRR